MIVFVVSILLLSFFLLLFFSFMSKSLKLIDYPSERKNHIGEIPLVGGISIYLSLIILLPFLDLSNWLNLIVLSSGIIVILGALDDALQLGISIRLLSQIIAGLIVIGGGLSIIDIGDYALINPIELGIFGVLLTLLFVVGLTNAINFMDGIDGLSSGLIIISIFSIYIFSNFDGGLIDEKIIILMIASLIVFIFFNMGWLPFQKVFLGDSGSMMLGFITAWMLIYYSHPDIRSIHPVLTLWCVTIPVYDLFSVTIRRIIIKRNPFKPDRMHLHHLLIERGCSSGISLLTILCLGIILNLLGGSIYFLFGPLPSLITYFIVFLSYILINLYIFKINN